MEFMYMNFLDNIGAFFDQLLYHGHISALVHEYDILCPYYTMCNLLALFIPGFVSLL